MGEQAKRPVKLAINKMKKTCLSERKVQLAVLDYLYKTGWGTNPHIKQANEKGVDIRVQNNKAKSRYFFIETKGESISKSAKSISETSFVYSLGQLVTRMRVVDARYAYQYGLGLPKDSAKIALRRIPWQFARKVCLHIFSVDHDLKVTDYSWQGLKKKQEK